MKENQVMVESCAECTVVIDVPDEHVRKVWTKRGQKYPFDRDQLNTLMYNTGVAALFHEGYLKCMDKEFMSDNDMLKDDGTPRVIEMTDALMKRLIGVMPMQEFKETLATLQPNQIKDLADFAIEHSTDLKMDKADILTKMTGKNILRAIEYANADQEG